MPIAGALTRGREALVEAASDPKCKTVKEAAARAGMHPVTASRALGSAIVQNAILVKKQERADTARPIMRKSLSKLSACIDSESDPQTLTGIAVGMSRIVESGVDEDQLDHVTQADHDRLHDKLIQMLAAGIRMGQRGLVPPALRHLIASEYPGKAGAEIVAPGASCEVVSVSALVRTEPAIECEQERTHAVTMDLD